MEQRAGRGLHQQVETVETADVRTGRDRAAETTIPGDGTLRDGWKTPPSSSHNVPAASKVRESELESHVHASDLHQNCGRALGAVALPQGGGAPVPRRALRL